MHQLSRVTKLRSTPLDQGLLYQAMLFFNAGSRCMAPLHITPLVVSMAVAPAIVCYALSLELYLKLLCLIAKGEPPTGHKLHRLYAMLPDGVKSELVKELGEDPQEGLAVAGEAFVHWRYQHEHESLSIDAGFLVEMCKAAHVVTKRLRPELSIFGENAVAADVEERLPYARPIRVTPPVK